MGALYLTRDHNCECHHDVPTHHFDRGILILKDLVKTTDQHSSGLVGNLSLFFQLLEQLSPLLQLAMVLTPGSIPPLAPRRSLL